MKKTNIFLLAILTLLAGCQKDLAIETSNGKAIETISSRLTNEICYENLQYVKFSSGESSWGGIQLDQNNKVIICKNNSKRGYDMPSQVTEFCHKGIVYIKFSSGESSWGSPKFDKDSKVLLCEKTNLTNKKP